MLRSTDLTAPFYSIRDCARRLELPLDSANTTPVSLPALARLLDRNPCTIKAMVARKVFPAPNYKQSVVGRTRWVWTLAAIASFISAKGNSPASNGGSTRG